jgi:NAD(P)-dependent dehydrogenase (short-subunit alcohol dehydrogenase family)/uncharacterized OB-fold protein
LKQPDRTETLPKLPPGERSRAGLGLLDGAARGRFELQVCRDCGSVQYPPREACSSCLSAGLDWKEQPGEGELIADTLLSHSHHPYFREHLPWRIGTVKLDAGPVLIVHVHGDCAAAPVRIRVGAHIDRAGQAVLVAFPPQETATMSTDPMLREMTCDPRSRSVLVTDGTSAAGQEITRALLAAGAAHVWVGVPISVAAPSGIRGLANVSLVPLDVRDASSVAALANGIGGQVDIVVNTAEHRGGAVTGAAVEIACAQDEIDVNYMGLLRLAQAFAPAMQARAANEASAALAWVNLLSVYALSNLPAQGTFCASKAAAFSLAQCLRAQLQAAGIRVINVFPGSLADETASAQALAQSMVRALREGIDDVYPDEVALDWFERWRDNPKALEREARG